MFRLQIQTLLQTPSDKPLLLTVERDPTTLRLIESSRCCVDGGGGGALTSPGGGALTSPDGGALTSPDGGALTSTGGPRLTSRDRALTSPGESSLSPGGSGTARRTLPHSDSLPAICPSPRVPLKNTRLLRGIRERERSSSLPRERGSVFAFTPC